MSKFNNQNIIEDMKHQTVTLDSDYSVNNKSIRSVLRIIKSETTQDGEGVILKKILSK